MRISENGIALIKEREGFAATPTDDEGHVMWGHGHDRVGDEPIPESISEEDADELLLYDLATRVEPVVNRLAPWANQNQFDALCDFTYNLGPGALSQLVSHGRSFIPAQMARWIHAGGKVLPGLVIRRQKEVVLYGA